MMSTVRAPSKASSRRGSTNGRSTSAGRSRRSVRTAQSVYSTHTSKTSASKSSRRSVAQHANSAGVRQRYIPPQVSLEQFDAATFDVVGFLDGILPLETLLPGKYGLCCSVAFVMLRQRCPS
jgi:hypothetical protein